MTAVCGNDGQWTPNPGHVTCSPTPTPTFTLTFTEASIFTPSATLDPTGLGESQLPLLITVKPPNKGHIGDGPFVPCREVVLFSEVFF